MIRACTDRGYHSPIKRRFNDLDKSSATFSRMNPARFREDFPAQPGSAENCPEMGFKHESQTVEIGLIGLQARAAKGCLRAKIPASSVRNRLLQEGPACYQIVIRTGMIPSKYSLVKYSLAPAKHQ
jgi:hypothetical protein